MGLKSGWGMMEVSLEGEEVVLDDKVVEGREEEEEVESEQLRAY